MKGMEQRFWEKVFRTDYCWLWRASVDRWGYGRFTIRQPDGKQKFHGAHRVTWFLTYGFFPKQFVLHRCDTPACVRPDHLFLGNAKDNALDSASKGRHWNQKLNAAQCEEIRKKYKPHQVKAKTLAKRYGVSAGRIYHVVAGA